MAEEKARFDPRDHLMSLKGKSYLPVFARVASFRDECPIQEGWGIRTEQIAGTLKDQFATFRAEIVDPQLRVVATGTKTEDVKGFPDFAEKAETGAIGRALAAAGFGTLYATEFDEGDRITDAPIAAKTAVKPRAAVAPPSAAVCAICKDASKPVPNGRAQFCTQQNVPISHFECSKSQEA